MDLATRILVALSHLGGRLKPADLSRYADSMAYSRWQMANAKQAYETYYERFQPFTAKTVLDLGCGDGGKTVYYGTLQPKLIVGIDIDVWKISAAKRFSDLMGVESRCSFLAGSADSCPFPSESFDTVVSEDAFEHYPDPAAVLREAFRLVRPGGLFIVRFATYYTIGGPHLYNFIRVPWPHLLFSDQTMIKATRVLAEQLARQHPEAHRREEYVAQAEREILQFQHLVNKITLARWRKLIGATQGWRTLLADTQCGSMKLPVFKLPLLEELNNNILYVLQRESSAIPTTGG